MEALPADGLIASGAQNGKSGYVSTQRGSATSIPCRFARGGRAPHGCRLTPGNSLEPVLAHFNARVAPLSGHMDAETVAAVAGRAAVEIENLSGKELRDDR
jgi:hypothetical protein